MNVKVRIGEGRIQCMQLSVDAVRFDDEMLFKLGFRKGPLGGMGDSRPATPEEIREYLRRLAADGKDVVPCGEHECDDKGRCEGEPLPE